MPSVVIPRSESPPPRLAWLATLVLGACGPDAGPGPDPSIEGPRQPRGQWYAAPTPMTDEQAARARELEGLGYASGMEDAAARTGVLRHDAARAHAGLNLYVSGHGAEARLVDMDGELIHRWERAPLSIWPDRTGFDFGYFRKARLLPDGGLLAIFEGKGLVCLERDSSVRWSYDGPAHHDVGVLPDGTIFALDREARLFPELDPEHPLLDDRITFFAADGEVLRRVSLMAALMRSPFAAVARKGIRREIRKGVELVEATRDRYAEAIVEDPSIAAKLRFRGDVFHSNSVRVVTEDVAAAIEGLEAGWFLLSVRELGALVALEVDGDEATARWYLEGSWRMQHEAVPLANGRVLLFDNQGGRRDRVHGHSRVVEVDPRDGAIVWSYAGVDPFGLSSPVGGSCQRLPNGNTLVIESTGGRAVEVTPGGEIVWEFVSPHRAGEDDSLIAFLPDVLRIERGDVMEWLDEAR